MIAVFWAQGEQQHPQIAVLKTGLLFAEWTQSAALWHLSRAGIFPSKLSAWVTQQDADSHSWGCSLHLPLCLGLAESLLQPL